MEAPTQRPRASGVAGFLVCVLAGVLAAPALGEPIRVVASIKPVHSLVSAVMAGVGEPHLIMRGAASPHDFSLRPSDARRIQEAHVVFLVAESLETSLAGPIDTLATDAHVVELVEADGLVRRPLRAGATFEAHDHGGHGDEADQDGEPGHHEGEDHAAVEDEHHGDDRDEHEAPAADDHGHEDDDHGSFDLHVWLDPHNAAAMTRAIAATLSSADPENMDAYGANAAAFAARLDALTQRIATQTAAVRGQPFIVFHDAYRHFEDRFGLAAAGSAVVGADRSPGVRRIAELRGKVGELGVRCVLAEPQFDGRLIEVIVEGSDARTGFVDPLGATLESGPELYFTLLGNMAASFVECLSSP